MGVKVDTPKEIVFGSSNPNVSRVISQKEKKGDLRKVASRIYPIDLVDKLVDVNCQGRDISAACAAVQPQVQTYTHAEGMSLLILLAFTIFLFLGV